MKANQRNSIESSKLTSSISSREQTPVFSIPSSKLQNESMQAHLNPNRLPLNNAEQNLTSADPRFKPGKLIS